MSNEDSMDSGSSKRITKKTIIKEQESGQTDKDANESVGGKKSKKSKTKRRKTKIKTKTRSTSDNYKPGQTTYPQGNTVNVHDDQPTDGGKPGERKIKTTTITTQEDNDQIDKDANESVGGENNKREKIVTTRTRIISTTDKYEPGTSVTVQDGNEIITTVEVLGEGDRPGELKVKITTTEKVVDM